MNELTFDQAQQKAINLAQDVLNQQWPKQKSAFNADNLPGKRVDGRWEFFTGIPVAGSWAKVSFNLDGSEPQVEAGFSPD